MALLKDSRIVLPKVYHKTAITFAYLNHRRIRKTKPVLQSKVFFFNMKKLVEEIQNCIACQSLTPTKPLQPTVAIKMPEKVSEIIHWDCLGPLPKGMD